MSYHEDERGVLPASSADPDTHSDPYAYLDRDELRQPLQRRMTSRGAEASYSSTRALSRFLRVTGPIEMDESPQSTTSPPAANITALAARPGTSPTTRKQSTSMSHKPVSSAEYFRTLQESSGAADNSAASSMPASVAEDTSGSSKRELRKSRSIGESLGLLGSPRPRRPRAQSSGTDLPASPSLPPPTPVAGPSSVLLPPISPPSSSASTNTKLRSLADSVLHSSFATILKRKASASPAINGSGGQSSPLKNSSPRKSGANAGHQRARKAGVGSDDYFTPGGLHYTIETAADDGINLSSSDRRYHTAGPILPPAATSSLPEIFRSLSMRNGSSEQLELGRAIAPADLPPSPDSSPQSSQSFGGIVSTLTASAAKTHSDLRNPHTEQGDDDYSERISIDGNLGDFHPSPMTMSFSADVRSALLPTAPAVENSQTHIMTPPVSPAGGTVASVMAVDDQHDNLGAPLNSHAHSLPPPSKLAPFPVAPSNDALNSDDYVFKQTAGTASAPEIIQLRAELEAQNLRIESLTRLSETMIDALRRCEERESALVRRIEVLEQTAHATPNRTFVPTPAEKETDRTQNNLTLVTNAETITLPQGLVELSSSPIDISGLEMKTSAVEISKKEAGVGPIGVSRRALSANSPPSSFHLVGRNAVGALEPVTAMELSPPMGRPLRRRRTLPSMIFNRPTLDTGSASADESERASLNSRPLIFSRATNPISQSEDGHAIGMPGAFRQTVGSRVRLRSLNSNVQRSGSLRDMRSHVVTSMFLPSSSSAIQYDAEGVVQRELESRGSMNLFMTALPRKKRALPISGALLTVSTAHESSSSRHSMSLSSGAGLMPLTPTLQVQRPGSSGGSSMISNAAYVDVEVEVGRADGFAPLPRSSSLSSLSLSHPPSPSTPPPNSPLPKKPKKRVPNALSVPSPNGGSDRPHSISPSFSDASTVRPPRSPASPSFAQLVDLLEDLAARTPTLGETGSIAQQQARASRAILSPSKLH